MPLFGILILHLLLVGCGEQKGTGQLPIATATPNWNVPPVAQTCTAGDVDHDGACDDVDPSVGDSDTDDDGELDGMDGDPAGPGSGHSSSHLSILDKALIGVAIVAASSVAYNFATGFFYDCQSTSLGGIQCIDANWDSATVEFNRAEQGDNEWFGQLTIKVGVTITKEHWLTFGFNWGNDSYSGEIEYKYRYKIDDALLANVSPALPGGLVLGGSSDAYKYMPKSGAPAEADLDRPAAAGIETSIKKGGCVGKSWSGPTATGALIRINGAPPYCLDSNMLNDYPSAFDESGDKFYAIFTSAANAFVQDTNKVIFRTVDPTKPLGLPLKVFSRANTIPYDEEDPLVGIW